MPGYVQIELLGSLGGVGEDGIAEEALGDLRVEVQSSNQGMSPVFLGDAAATAGEVAVVGEGVEHRARAAGCGRVRQFSF